jgi:hypothetical protein
MKTFSQRFHLTQIPTGSDVALDLSTRITMDFGMDGWSLVSVVPVGPNALLLAFEKPFDPPPEE